MRVRVRVMVEIHLKRKIFVKICVKTCVNCVGCVWALRTVNPDRESLRQYEYHPRALCAPRRSEWSRPYPWRRGLRLEHFCSQSRYIISVHYIIRSALWCAIWMCVCDAWMVVDMFVMACICGENGDSLNCHRLDGSWSRNPTAVYMCSTRLCATDWGL